MLIVSLLNKLLEGGKTMYSQGTGKRCKTIYAAGMLLLILLASSCSPELPDYDIYATMRQYAQQKLAESGATARPDFPAKFSDEYIINLVSVNPLFAVVFGGSELEVHLASYESAAIAVSSLSQFEVPPGSENFTDFAFVVRPAASLRAPFVHGDALKGMAGSDSSFSMDFYNINREAIDYETFFGDQVAKLDEAMALVAPYQRQGEDRGKYTKHLVEYKSPYRIEIDESYIPEGTDRKVYYDDVLAAYKLFMDAYFTSLERLQPDNDTALVEGTKQGTDAFIQTLYEEDTAVSLGRQLFGDDIDTYFLDGFWRDGYYGQGL